MNNKTVGGYEVKPNRKAEMKNPPDFVMYVVMEWKNRKYSPRWFAGCSTPWTIGYATRERARRALKLCPPARKKPYVQQYGPYS